jgi:hypothetical protein
VKIGCWRDFLFSTTHVTLGDGQWTCDLVRDCETSRNKLMQKNVRDKRRIAIQSLLSKGHPDERISIHAYNLDGNSGWSWAEVFGWIHRIRDGKDEIRNEIIPEDLVDTESTSEFKPSRATTHESRCRFLAKIWTSRWKSFIQICHELTTFRESYFEYPTLWRTIWSCSSQ